MTPNYAAAVPDWRRQSALVRLEHKDLNSHDLEGKSDLGLKDNVEGLKNKYFELKGQGVNVQAFNANGWMKGNFDVSYNQRLVCDMSCKLVQVF